METEGSNNTVLITGANRGLGLGFVRHYLEKGDSVVAASRRSQAAGELAEVAELFADRIQIVPLDVSDETSIAEFVGHIRSQGITFDIVISNAGVSTAEAFGQWTSRTFGTHFLVNTIGPALLAQAIEPFLHRGAKLVHMSSGIGSIGWNIGPEDPLDAYAISKCGLNMLTRRLAEKLRPQDIAVYSMNPGWVRTDMGGAEAPTPVNESIQEMVATIERIGIGETGNFLASDGSHIPW